MKRKELQMTYAGKTFKFDSQEELAEALEIRPYKVMHIMRHPECYDNRIIIKAVTKDYFFEKLDNIIASGKLKEYEEI